MIHQHHQLHPTQINVSQPPPPQHLQQQQHIAQQPNPNQRMNHHHYQQRLNHQQIQQQQQQQQQQQLPPQIRSNLNGINPNHQVPPPIIQKQHLHQNIATLNQKPPQHVSSQSSSQIQSTNRMSYEKPSLQGNNLKRESSTISVPCATATLPSNNSSIVTCPPPSVTISVPPPTSATSSSLSHHHHAVNILPKYQQQQQQQQHHIITSIDASATKSEAAKLNGNKENIIPSSSSSILNVSVLSNSSSVGIELNNGENTEKGLESLANTKEKTPMCLVNELARFNKIQHQYRLIGEQGPAHKKRFTVILKLGEEEYVAEGLSIKKAQHSAAKEAILKTAYKHPPLKTNRQLKGIAANAKTNTGNITPTVELNALAMKRGEPTVYTVTSTTTNPIAMPPNGQFTQQPPPPFNPRGNPYQPRRFGSYRGGGNFQPGRFSSSGNGSASFGTETFHVALQVGNRTFSGMGPTQQAARHDAAARALEVLKPLTVENEMNGTMKSSTCASSNDSENGDDSLINSDIKSPISIVHEMALKRKMTVTFEVQSEKGPPHMKVYTTLCKVGTIVTEGEGNGKKLSKKKAAEKMMDELKKLPPLSPVEEPPNRVNPKVRRKQQQLPIVKKKSRNLIKEKLEASANADEINPISQLIQIQQSRKEKEPVYTVIDERGTARRREFVIEVSAAGFTASGTGPNKKLAKKIAAENLLILMGIGKPSVSSGSDTPSKECISRKLSDSKKVQFNESSAEKKPRTPGNGRQIVPGLLLVSQAPDSFTTPTKAVTTMAKESPPESSAEKTTTTTSPSSVASNQDSGIGESGVSPRDQLNYLAQLIGFTVSYSDFPKGNHSEFLSLVTLSTDPPHMSHGAGSNVDESRDQAALKALGVLSELGLDNVKPKSSAK